MEPITVKQDGLKSTIFLSSCEAIGDYINMNIIRMEKEKKKLDRVTCTMYDIFFKEKNEMIKNNAEHTEHTYSHIT